MSQRNINYNLPRRGLPEKPRFLLNTIDSLYIHFPFCRHLCNYCDFYKTAPSANERSGKVKEFQAYLDSSFTRLNEFMRQEELVFGPLDTLYIGGGTPSLWGESGASYLKRFLNEKLKGLSQKCEATLEVNPGTWTPEILKQYSEIGFNRFSLGVQSTEGKFLEKLDRIHRKEEVIDTLNFFNSIDANFSVDFMIGLPFSREYKRNIISELEEILSYKPSHISLYILTVKENYRYFENLPNDEWIEKEYLEVSKFLMSRGFEHYEISNFCVEGKNSKHNSKYWKGDSIAALGPSATGYFAKNKKRFKWKSLTPDFEIETLNENEIRMESFYLGLRTSVGIRFKEFFKDEELSLFGRLMANWKDRGLCKFDEKSVMLTPRGYLVMDSLMDDVFREIKSL